MNEIQAAFGLVQLKHVDKAIVNRKAAAKRYRDLLRDFKGVSVLDDQEFVKSNYSYFPILINPVEFGSTIDDIVAYLETKNVFAKRYFYPLVNDYKGFSNCKKSKLPNAEKITENIMCLPLSHEISSVEIEYIVSLLFQLHK
jgi:dTDP-4-amino-4,6-dideoxygalactose transaminase